MVNKKQLGIGLGILTAGIANYLINRPWNTYLHAPFRAIDNSLFNGNIESALHQVPNYIGSLEGYTPNFLGSMGLALTYIGLFDGKNKLYQIGHILLIYTTYELGQKFGIFPGEYAASDIMATLAGTALASGIAISTSDKKTLDDKLQTSVS